MRWSRKEREAQFDEWYEGYRYALRDRALADAAYADGEYLKASKLYRDAATRFDRAFVGDAERDALERAADAERQAERQVTA